MTELTCSFCSETPNDGIRMIAGPECFICTKCVILCAETLGMNIVAPAGQEDFFRKLKGEIEQEGKQIFATALSDRLAGIA